MKERLKRLPVLGTAIRMQERYVEDAADALAASIGFFGFLSLFPLLALLLSVVGFVLGDSFVERQQLVDTVTGAVPGLRAIIGDENQVSKAVNTIADSPGALLSFGSIGVVLAGLRIASGAQQASAVVFRRERPAGLGARVGQLRAVAVVGAFALAGAAVSGSVGVDISNGVEGLLVSILGIAVAFGLDFLLFLLAYRLFTPGPGPDWHTLVPGSLLAATGWVTLKIVGATYVSNQASSAESSYGALGPIIGLLLLLYLAGRLYLYGAELAALLGHVDQVPARGEMAEQAVRVPRISPRPEHDEAPEPTDAARLAASGVLLGLAAAVLARALED